MDDVLEQMKVVLATTFSLYLKSHNYHWNVTGPNFSEYHNFLGTFYEEVFESIDHIAEHIRTMGVYAPGSFTRFMQLSKIADEMNIPDSNVMFARLHGDNAILIRELYLARDMAGRNGQAGLVGFLETRIDYHEKMSWMLRAFNA